MSAHDDFVAKGYCDAIYVDEDDVEHWCRHQDGHTDPLTNAPDHHVAPWRMEFPKQETMVRWLDGQKLRMSKATKHKSMRMRWSDGTPVEANFYAKGPSRSQVHLQHRKLASRAEAERLRAFWAGCLVRLGKVVAEK